MAMYSESKVRYMQVRGLPAGVFGETYIVAVAVHTVSSHYQGEVYVISQRADETLNTVKVHCNGAGVDAELTKIDLDYVLEEGIWHAEQLLFSMLARRAVSLSAPHVEELEPEIKESPSAPIVSCWLRGKFHSQIREMADQTESETFARHLGMVMQAPIIVQQRD